MRSAATLFFLLVSFISETCCGRVGFTKMDAAQIRRPLWGYPIVLIVLDTEAQFAAKSSRKVKDEECLSD